MLIYKFTVYCTTLCYSTNYQTHFCLLRGFERIFEEKVGNWCHQCVVININNINQNKKREKNQCIGERWGINKIIEILLLKLDKFLLCY